MTAHIGETHDHAAVGERFPVEVVATCIIGRMVPTSNLEPRNLGSRLGQQRLLDGTRYLKIVLYNLKLLPRLCFSKGSVIAFKLTPD